MDTGRLRNDDFRKLLLTPSVRSSDKTLGAGDSFAKPAAPNSATFTHRQATQNASDKKKKYKKFNKPGPKEKKEKTEVDELAEESDQRLSEIMTKYRDRAAERRKGENETSNADIHARIGHRSFKEDDLNAAERREHEIRESKYLGGDMEHTHLVKGLDYSLLKKTKSEAVQKEESQEKEDDGMAAFENPITRTAYIKQIAKTPLSYDICKVLFDIQTDKRNELFQKGRMAYVVDLEEEAQNDVPVTLLRSTAEVINDKSEQNISANNIIINKLADVLSYLRADGKKKKKEKEVAYDKPSDKPKDFAKDIKIYDDLDDYVPDRSSKKSRNDKDRREKEKRSYFDDKDQRRDRRRDDSRERERRDDRERKSDRDGRRRNERRRSSSPSRKRTSEKGNETKDKFPSTSSAWKTALEAIPEPPKPKKSKVDEDDAYGELFPSSDLFYGAAYDSDDEDLSKMDMGNRKGPIKRWDFETQEDYEKYQSGREAMPKAVFQYGVKTNANRKTRKTIAAEEEKKYDKQYEKIEKIWEQRKQKH